MAATSPIYLFTGPEFGKRNEAVDAVKAAQKNSLPEDFIFVGGSNFIVADLLAGCDALNLDKRILR